MAVKAPLANYSGRIKELQSGDSVGGVSLASTTEVLTGTDAAKAVTPDALAALWEQGADIASAGTLTVGEGGAFDITGTTTITDIDFAVDRPGRTVSFRFKAALTLTHSSTLILPTGANITTVAGDVAIFRNESSDIVRCISFERASGSALAIPTASITEVITGTDTAKAVTPQALAAGLWEAGSDVASAGTITLGDGGHFYITGTTGITDIDWTNEHQGRTAWLHFQGALTLTHSSTLILPTGANITTAAGDVACFRSEKTADVVRCISYLRASGAALAGSGGAVATDVIFDAKGDLPVGTGADTAAKLTAGANDTFLIADSAQSTGLKWGTPSTARTALGLNISDTPLFGEVSIGNADTTITRSSSGDLAVEGNGLYRANGTDVPITDGGTGASDASTARTNLGLGSIATQAASSVSISGGSITGITDLAIADGGTGASTAAAARINLGIPRTLFDHYTDETTAGTTIDTLYTDTIAAATLTANGDKLVGCYAGISTANVNEKDFLVDFASTTLLSNLFSSNIYDWNIDFTIIRVSNTVVRCSARMTNGLLSNSPYIDYVEVTGLNLTTTGYDLRLRLTTGDAAGDVTAKLAYCQYIPAA